MKEDCLLREEKNGVLYLTLNRPEKLNALDTVMFREILDAVKSVEDREDIHVIVLQGAGKCFCAGHDVAVLGQPDQDELFNSNTVRALADSPKAVVALIHSHCYTGALELACAADIIIASENAKIGDTHSKFALRPIWGLTQRLPRRVGISHAKDMLFTSKTINGREAERIGLADYCFADDIFREEAEKVIQKINASSPFSISYIKKIMKETDGQNITCGLDREILVDQYLGPDFKERLDVLNKRK